MKGGAAAMQLSVDLARTLGQLTRRVSENVVEVRSRNPKTPNTWYAATRGVDDSLICSCIASFYPYRGECWHLGVAREEFGMTSEARALVPIVVKPSMELLPSSHDLDVVERAAAMAFQGKVALPEELKTQQQVAAVMLYGLELGVKPMTALRHLYIVKGKVSPSAELMAGLCMAKEKDISFHIEEINERVCTIRMLRPSRKVDAVYTVTWEQIERAGLASNGVNKQYPEDRLRYHCMKRLMRAYAQDLLNNLDEGVVLPGLDESQPWRPTVVDSSDLYNEGDEEASEETVEDVANGVVEDVPTATDEQIAAITDWSEQLKNLDDGKERLLAVDKVRRETWPYAIGDGNRFSASKLTQADADRYIVVLKEAYEGVQQPALV
jgi:hypothetical protein